MSNKIPVLDSLGNVVGVFVPSDGLGFGVVLAGLGYIIFSLCSVVMLAVPIALFFVFAIAAFVGPPIVMFWAVRLPSDDKYKLLAVILACILLGIWLLGIAGISLYFLYSFLSAYV